MAASGFSRKDLPANMQDPALGVTVIGTIYLDPENWDPQFPEMAEYKLERPIRALYVGVTGDVTALMFDGSYATFLAVPAGTILPIVCVGFSTMGTTAGELVGLH